MDISCQRLVVHVDASSNRRLRSSVRHLGIPDARCPAGAHTVWVDESKCKIGLYRHGVDVCDGCSFGA